MLEFARWRDLFFINKIIYYIECKMSDSMIKSCGKKVEGGNGINKGMMENSMSRELDQLTG